MTSSDEKSVQYQGVVVGETDGSPRVVLFAAPAQAIEQWSGVPQRRRLDAQGQAVETAGFQREENEKRVAEIAAFMDDQSNVIQNPLLAAVQDRDRVVITPNPSGSSYCTVSITVPDLASEPLLLLIRKTMDGFESRLPELSTRPPDAQMLQAIRHLLSLSDASATDEDLSSDEPDQPAETQEVDLGMAIFEDESRLVELYDELKARATVLEELGDDAADLDSLAGFHKDFLISLLKPVVLVDGQHRLKGALRAAELFENSEAGTELLAQKVDEGMDPAAASLSLAEEHTRVLPVSLLMSEDPAEHVFQFVVVNQKATPMSNALLGTIVSTSLTQDEMDPIRQRLKAAGIELEGSRAISYMSRSPESPFRNLVMTGVGGDRPQSLPWSVMGGLISVVQDLAGGEPFHPPKVDYARLWRDGKFRESGIVDTSLTDEERIATWSAIDGPWRLFFIKLHTKIRNTFGDVDDPNAKNYWGSTKSNLFNMISLRILTADFFAFIQLRTINDWDELDAALSDWLDGLNPQYFARDWRMEGTKKDQPAIRLAWSETWAGYRITRGNMPRVEKYNPGGKGVGN